MKEYYLKIELTFDEQETLLKALESASKRHPGSGTAIKCKELLLRITDNLLFMKAKKKTL